jgi:uncharacterized protein (TIGR03435 family)
MGKLIALAALSTVVLLAQDMTGTWQGTLAPPGGQELRGVFKISKNADGTRCIFYTIDQSSDGFACNVTVTGPNVKIAVPSRNSTYEGKFASGGDDLFGTWTNGGTSLPLVLQHVKEDLAWPLPEVSVKPKVMAADADPAFDVASIKPADPNARGRLYQMPGREFRAINASANNLIELVYGVHPKQIVGAPAWMETDKYNIVGTPDKEGFPSREQWMTMVKKLLADRFQLQFHREQKELPIYAIQIGKNGPKLTKSESDPHGPQSLAFRGGNLPARNASMAEFAAALQRAVLDRPVIDQTGLEGKWDFVLKWTPDGNQFANLGGPPRTFPDGYPDDTPDLVTAMQNQLGLKLIATKAMVDVIVVDRAEKPGAN